jgi:hypothetical protein
VRKCFLLFDGPCKVRKAFAKTVDDLRRYETRRRSDDDRFAGADVLAEACTTTRRKFEPTNSNPIEIRKTLFDA